MQGGKRILGFDPGLSGAGALYLPDEIVPTVEGGLFDLPTMGDSKDRELDYAALRNIVFDLRPDVAFVELVGTYGGGEGGRFAGLSKMVGTFYAIRAVCACLGVPCRKTTAQQWKKHFGLKGGKENKEAGRKLAVERWPSLHPFLKRVKDQNRAEAFLIAAHGAHRISRE